MPSSRRDAFKKPRRRCTGCTNDERDFGDRATWLAARQDVTFATTFPRGALDGQRKRPSSRSPRIGSPGAHGSGRGQGPEEQRDRLPLEPGDRGGLHGARVLPGGDTGVHSRRQGSGGARAGGAAGVVHTDAVDRGRVPRAEPRGPRCGHDVRVDDAGAGTGPGLGQRLGDLPGGRAGDGLAGADRGDLHLQAVRVGSGRQLDVRADRRRRALDSGDDVDLLARHRALGARAAVPG